jgi:hypothetical protein
VAGGNHDTDIADLPPAERTAAVGALARWAGVTPRADAARAPDLDDPRRGRRWR